MDEAELNIFIGVGENDSDALRVTLEGSPNQALGFIARAEFELAKLKAKVLADLAKPKEPTHV